MKQKRSQPRLPHGIRRESIYSCLHPVVKQIVRRIARKEGKSLSWVMAEFISMGCGVNPLTGELTKVIRFRGRNAA